MKLIVVAVLVAFAAAKLFSDDLSDSLTNPAELPPFKAGQQYRYRFDSQVASGIAGISHQKSLTRIQAEANVYFESDRSVVLRLDKIQVGAVNARMIQEPSRMHPFSLVEQKQIEAHQLSKLQLPLQFNYIDGLIDRISFHSDDDTWSKNIKRSVLNLLQVNLKGKNLPEEQEKEIKAQDPKWQELTPRAFTAPETTIEGECDTTYVISKLENLPRTDVDFFNVTKTINFQRCQKLSDVHYGPRVESQLNNNWQEQSLGQEVDRSTIIRHFVVGTPEKFSIKRVESVSQYTFNTFNAEQEAPMLSVVVNELTCIGATKDSSKRLTGPSDSQDETLLYSNAFDRDVKRFYMYGDEEYQQETPFSRIQNKQKLIFDVLRQIQKTTEDKKVGVEAEATVLLPRLVELVRTCTVQELKEIVERVDKKAEEILIDALAIAATRNTIHVMAEKIMQRKLSVPKAIQTLKALREVPAPSDKQVDILIRLCKSDRVKESESLRQTCWLTVGTLMGEFCETSKQNSYVINEQTESEMCPKHFTDKFIETLFEEYQEADTRYERILILKSYGNAGLKESVRKLKKIIYDQKEDPLVRAQAIDSLRRLRNKIPNELQQILLPVFKNQQELTEVRLHALSLVLQTVPNKAVIDQIASVLIRDKSKNVKSFVYDVVKSYAMSPLAEEQNIAQNLQAVLKLAGIDEKEEEKLRSSRAQHIPIYSNQQDEGVFLNLESIFASDNAFPKKLSAGLDSFLNGVFEKNTLEINIQQEDVERWYEKTVNQWFSESQSRGRSSSSRSESELGNIFSKLIGKSRRDALAQSQGRKYQSPFGFLSLRLRDIDVAVLPLEEEVMPKALQQIIINAKKPTLRDFDQPLSLLNGETFRLNTAWNFYERMTKIPTTAGIPLKLTLSVPALLSVEGSGRLRKSGVAIKVQPSIAVSHVKKIEAWSPLVNSGVENVVSVESNIPIDGELMVEGSEKKTVKVTMNLPEFENRLLGFHSLPVTYIREYDQETGVHKEPRVKTIQNELLVERDWHLDHLVGQETLGLPLHFNGHIHIPAQYSYLAIVNALSMAENHVHVEFKPTQDSPRQVQLTLEGETFHRIQSKLRPQFRSFYDKFDAEMEERYEFRDNNQAKDEQRLDRIAQDYQTRDVYRHGFEARLQTIGGRQEKSGKVQLESTCDAKFGYCKTEIKMERDSLFEGERRDWKLESTVQTILPEYSADFEQYQEKKDQKSQKFICAIDCRWGTDAQQYINIRVNGEQAKTQAWIDEEETQAKKFNSPELREKSAFLNKYDISAEYELSPEVKSLFSRGLDLFKLVNFWNTKTELVQEKKVNGLVTALVVIDPISRQHMNVSIKTPTEKIRVNSITTNVKVSPFPLIRRPTQPLNSAKQLLTSIIAKDDNTPQECSIDGSQVRTFDDVVFKAPITKCYTVLAKDCNRDSRFAVLMKKINGENKKLKMIDRKNIIEVESEQGDDQFQIRVNDEHIPESQWDNYGITKLDNLVSIETHDITVRFNGRQAWIQISRLYKHDQCGICGHYDDDAENEFVQGNNEKTSDLRQYYRSFTMKDSECDEDFEESIRKHKFETVEENEFGRWDDDSDSYENGGEEPIEKTQVVEYNHKICFSKKPVPECPRNLYPTQSKKDLKVQYGCLTRDSIQARRLIRQLKTDPEGVAREAHQLALSFTETLKVPTRCVEF